MRWISLQPRSRSGAWAHGVIRRRYSLRLAALRSADFRGTVATGQSVGDRPDRSAPALYGPVRTRCEIARHYLRKPAFGPSEYDEQAERRVCRGVQRVLPPPWPQRWQGPAPPAPGGAICPEEQGCLASERENQQCANVSPRS